MEKDLISAIFPWYNVAKFLPDLFESLEKMDYENVEYIFVNDGSKDDTLELLKTFCQNKSNCQVVDQENQKLCMARNNGLKAAKIFGSATQTTFLPHIYFLFFLKIWWNTMQTYPSAAIKK